jgi:DNA repair protein RadC
MSTDSLEIKIPYFIADKHGKYKATRALTEKQIVSAAKALLKKKFTKGQVFSCPQVTHSYLMCQYANYEHEVFVCIFLDNQHQLIKEVEMFRGTIDSASIYPREVVKKALELNAAAVIFAHNHPSGESTPSQADKNITEKLKKALDLVDIRSLDHIIIGGAKQYSFAESGLM